LPGTGNTAPGGVLFIFENPDYLEDRTGRPRVGKVAAKWRELLGAAGVKEEEVYSTCAVKCHKPGSKGKSTTPGITNVRACRPYLLAEISLLKPRAIVCQGTTALRAVLGTGKVALGNVLGAKVCDDPATYATYSPGAVGHFPHYGIDWVATVHRAVTGFTPGASPTVEVECDPFAGLGGVVALDLETYPGLDPFAPDARIRFASTSHSFGEASFATQEEVALLGNRQIWKAGSNIKFDVKWMRRHWDLSPHAGPWWDTALAERLLSPESPDRGLKTLGQKYCPELGMWAAPIDVLKKARGGWEHLEDSELRQYGLTDADASLRVATKQFDILADSDMAQMRFGSKMINHLATMELRGVKVDTGKLEVLNARWQAEIETRRVALRERIGCSPDSPKQLAAKYGLVNADKKALGAIAAKHHILTDLLAYRKLTKLYSTYVAGVATRLDGDGRLHCNFRIDGTKTGRLSCSDPNLQNIANNVEVKECYVPFAVGDRFLEIDFSQAEIVGAALLSRDRQMLRDLASGFDFHTITGRRQFGRKELTKDQRRAAKTTSFHILYGGSAYGLSARLGIPGYRAQQWISTFFDAYPDLRQWQYDCIRSAKNLGYVATWFGRMYRFSQGIDWSLDSPQGRHYRRIAVNAPVQGTVGQLTQMAQLALAAEGVVDVLQVHDSLLCILPRGEDRDYVDRCLEVCENLDFSDWNVSPEVPFKVEAKVGPDWGHMVEYERGTQ